MNEVKSVAHSHPFSISNEATLAQVFWVVTFAILTAVGAQIEIPNRPVPFTLQTLAVLLAGGLMGKRNGSISMLLYLGIGLAGMPVFSSGGFGLARILGPTGGYLLAFPVAAYVAGKLSENRKSLFLIGGSMFIALVVVFVLGTLQLGLVLGNWNAAVNSGFLIFSFWDAVKLAAATGIVYRFKQSRVL
jgi:biotin transport system substrate-specific component